jgi:hypothetical protein
MNTKDKRKKLLEAVSILSGKFIANNIFVDKIGTKYIHLIDIADCSVHITLDIDLFYDIQKENFEDLYCWNDANFNYSTTYPRLQKALCLL